MVDKEKMPERRKPSAKAGKEAAPKTSCLVAVRLRGNAGVSKDLRATLNMLRLRRRHNAVVLYSKPDTLGMLRKVKDYITWGEADKTLLKALLAKRCRPLGTAELTAKYLKEKLEAPSIEKLAEMIERGEIPLAKLWAAGIPTVFHLHPPKGGFKRSLKRPIADGGELGYRGKEIASLVSKMT